MRLARPSDVCPNLNITTVGKTQKLFKNRALYQIGKTKMKYTYLLRSNSAFKIRREASQCRTAAFFAVENKREWKNCQIAVKLLCCNLPWSLSLETEMEISLSTSGKSSNFQDVFVSTALAQKTLSHEH